MLTQVTSDVISTNTISGLISAGFTSMNVATFGTQTIEFGSSNTLVFRANTSTERMRITANGDIGIGTSSPASLLHVVGGTIVEGIDRITLRRATTPSGAGTTLSAVQFAAISTGTTYVNGSLIISFSDGAWSSTSAPTNITFRTTPSASVTAAERMRIDSSGNVGIATTAPAQRLHIGLTGANNYIQFGTTDEGFVIGRENATGEFTFDATQASPYNVFKWRQSGTERMRINSSGALLVNTTTQTGNTRMVVADSAGGGQIRAIHSTGSGFLINQESAAGNTSLNNQDNAALLFNTNNLERMRIDSSGLIGIGTSSPSSKLTIDSGGIEIRSGNALLIRPAGNANDTRLVALSTDGLDVVWGGAPSTSLMRFTNGGNLLVGITSARANAGDVQVSKGISFPATQSAQSDANTLDDYEEGTFTPTIAGVVTQGTATYSTQVGQYTKIGDRVFFLIRVGWSGGTGAGSMVIRGLPFTQFNGNGDIPYAASEWSDIAWSANYSPTPVGGQNTTQIYLNQSRIGGSGTADNTAYDAAGFFSLTGHYKIA